MIPLDSFVAHSADGKLVPVVPGGHNIPLTFSNRTEYVERALEYRLHEMDRQVTPLQPYSNTVHTTAVYSQGHNLLIPIGTTAWPEMGNLESRSVDQ